MDERDVQIIYSRKCGWVVVVEQEKKYARGVVEIAMGRAIMRVRVKL